LAVAKYEIRDLVEITKIPIGPHDALIIDPAWSEQEILDLDQRNPLVSNPGFSRVFYFGISSRGDIIVNAISNFKDFDRISKNALTWLVSQGGRENQVYWGGSFWTTVDVLATLVDFDYPITQYEAPLAKEIKKHDVDGSYDEVVGTSCGLIQIYYWLYGKASPQYKRTLQWIKSSYKEKTLYEQATALDVLARLGENIEDYEIRRFKGEVSALAFTNEFALQRYVSTLLACGFNEDAERLALRLESLQNIADGSWINIPNTAATTLTLIQLQSKFSKSQIEVNGE
jgi:hypothetical protein